MHRDDVRTGALWAHPPHAKCGTIGAERVKHGTRKVCAMATTAPLGTRHSAPGTSPFDVAILGGGPGGYVAAIRAAQLGLKTAVIEKEALGGTCLVWGCIPTKALHHTAEVWRTVGEAAHVGVLLGDGAAPALDWERVMAHKDAVVRNLVGGVEGLMKGNGVTVFKGTGTLVTDGPPHRLVVTDPDGGTTEVEATHVVLATGSRPIIPPIPGVDLPGVITSNDMLTLSRQPRTLVVVGGGVIGMEFGTIFAALGTRVSVIELLPNVLTGVEPELVRRATPMFRKLGMNVTTGAKVTGITWGDEDDLAVHYTTDKGEQTVEAEAVLIATSRAPNTQGAWADHVPLALNGRAVAVDADLRTNVPNVYAIGDVALLPQLAHTASTQGELLMERLVGHDAHYDPAVTPNCVFTLPEMSGVGLTEEQAKERHGAGVRTGTFPFAALGRAQILGETQGVVKLVADADGKLLGAHILGPRASDLIAELALALKMGATATDIAHTIHAHPTLPEAIHEAALALVNGKPIHALR